MHISIEERNKLLTDNLDLIHYFLHKHWRIHKEDQDYEDIFQECCLGFLKLFNTCYWNKKDERGLAGHIYWSVAYGVKQYYLKKSKFIEISGDEYVADKDDKEFTTYFDVLFNESDEKKYSNEIIDYIYSLDKKTPIPGKNKHCTLKRPEIIFDYYIYELNQYELAEKYGLSQERIKQILHKELEKIQILVKKKFGNDMYLHCSF